MSISNLKQKTEAIPTKRLQEMIFEKHLSILWHLLLYALFRFSITYYLFEGGTHLWKLTMLP